MVVLFLVGNCVVFVWPPLITAVFKAGKWGLDPFLVSWEPRGIVLAITWAGTTWFYRDDLKAYGSALWRRKPRAALLVLGALGLLALFLYQWFSIWGSPEMNVLLNVAIGAILIAGVSWGLNALKPNQTSAVTNDPAAAAKIAALQAELTEARKVSPPTPAKGADTALMEAALAFAARNGKKPIEIQNAIQIRADNDGKGPYISAWDYSIAGPWPSVGNEGFTAFQLRMLPAVFPALKTQGAREQLGNALNELSDMCQQVKATADKANNLRGSMPPMTNLGGLGDQWERVAKETNDLRGANSRQMEYFDQEMLPKKYPLYSAEIAGTVPRQTAQPYFIKLRDSLAAYEAFARLMIEISQSDRLERLTERASPLYGSVYQDVSHAAGAFGEWSVDCNRRIGMMLRAL